MAKKQLNVSKANDQPDADNMKKKAAILEELHKIIREAEETLKVKETGNDLTKLNQARQEKILETLNDHVRRVDTERVEFKQEVQRLHNEMEIALQDKSSLEKKVSDLSKERDRLSQQVTELKSGLSDALALADAAAKENSRMEEEITRLRVDANSAEELKKRVKTLSAELKEAVTIADDAMAEKAKLEDRLSKLQQNWDKYVAGS